MTSVLQRKVCNSAMSGSVTRNVLMYDSSRVRMEDYNKKYKNLLNSIYGRATLEYIEIVRKMFDNRNKHMVYF